jgi:hypothetical protein
VYDIRNKYKPTGPPSVGREDEMPILLLTTKIKGKVIPVTGRGGS